MPSKSKAQAHLMAAAAHNPEIAKDAGIPQSVAKDFNQADKKEGTLKKGSKKPEHVNEEVINEASGVGIIKVPPALLNKVQRYISSILLTMGLMKQKDLESEGQLEQAKSLNTYLKRFQNKFNASVLSPADMKKYINSVSTVPVDADEVFSQLPENIKKRPGVKEILDNLVIRLRISNQVYDEGRGGSSHTTNSGNINIQEIGIPRYRDIKDGSLNYLAHSFNYAMGTVEHELQHAIQSTILGRLNKHDKQLEIKPGYGNMDDAYYASGVEFGPQVKDLATSAKEWLEENPDSITGNKNTDISNAIKHAMSSMKQHKIIQALRNYKHDDRANKAMKLIYREVNNFYENEYANMSDSGEIDTSEQDVFKDTSNTSRSLERPEAGETVMGDLWLSIAQYFGEKPNAYGTFEDLKEIRFKRPYGEISIEPAADGGVHLYVRIQGDSENSWNIELNEQQAKKLIQDVGYFSTIDTTKKLRDKLEYETAPKADLAKADYIVYDTDNTESLFNDDPNKSVQAEYDQDEGTVYVYFKGARQKMYVQNNHKDYYIGYGEEQGTTCKSKDFQKIMEELIKFYYEPGTTDRMISRTLRSLTKNGGTITPRDVEHEIEYTKRLAAEKDAVSESSMRGWVDVIQNAELEHNIDDADEQELIHKGQLEEMPQRFDAFAGQDPNDFVDRTAKMNNQANMVPVADHGNFKVLKSKNGTGYIAYDQNNKPIAIVSGYSSGGVFHEEAIASKSNNKGVVYQIYMDILNDGQQILSDTLHSDDAIRFWQKLISNHEVYIVGDGKVLAKATPEKFHKYWGEEDSPSAELQLLLVK
ncbi:hypothetical protein DQT32_03175 [Salmonella enterica subsp. enterica serovar Braenderup]|nr:hypothetical protein [Salmonella enterica subsp. enterica serovar Braenderup]